MVTLASAESMRVSRELLENPSKLPPYLRLDLGGPSLAHLFLMSEAGEPPYYVITAGRKFPFPGELRIDKRTVDAKGVLKFIVPHAQNLRGKALAEVGRELAAQVILTVHVLGDTHDSSLEELRKYLTSVTRLKVIDGETTPEQLEMLSLRDPPVPQYLLDVANENGLMFDIGLRDVIESYVKPKYAAVRQGEWDKYSRVQARRSLMPPQLSEVMKSAGLRFVPAQRQGR